MKRSPLPPHAVVGCPPAPRVLLVERATSGTLHLDDLAVVALRRNRLRSTLIVSPVLAKHLPTRPSLSRIASCALATAIEREHGAVVPGLVLGMAETATALGDLAAEVLGAPAYATTTRHPDRVARVGVAHESHSHAPVHLLDMDLVDATDGPIVVVDDEVTTGSTFASVRATIDPEGEREVFLACLLDSRAAPPAGDVAVVRYRADSPEPTSSSPHSSPPLRRRAPGLTRGLRGDCLRLHSPYGGQLVDARARAQRLEQAMAVADALSPRLDAVVHCVGVEEVMMPAFLVAEALEALGHSVTVQSTTRSPIVVAQTPGYPIRSSLEVPCATDPMETAYLYNFDSSSGHAVAIGPSPAVNGLGARLRDVGVGVVHEVVVS